VFFLSFTCLFVTLIIYCLLLFLTLILVLNVISTLSQIQLIYVTL